jgi:hypothetical protein
MIDIKVSSINLDKSEGPLLKSLDER